MPPSNQGRTTKDATTKRRLPKGPYGPQTQTATSGWGRGFSTQRSCKKQATTVWYGVVWYHTTPSHPTDTPPHPHTTPSHGPPAPQARGDAVLIPSNVVGDAWVRRALLKVRLPTHCSLLTTCYLLVASYYLQLRMVSSSRPCCLRSSSCPSIDAASKCSSRTSTSL